MEETFEDEIYLKSRGSLFAEFRDSQMFTDVVIVTNDGTKFDCHKIILMDGCPFFKGLFSSNMVETRQNEINLNQINISGPHFSKILKYIYTGKIILDYEDAKAVNIYSTFFTMANLKNLTELCLIKHVKNETALELWRHSETYFNDKLKDSCVMAASNEMCLDMCINELTVEEIKSIASLTDLKCTSTILLKNVVKWIKLDFESRQSHIKDLMEFINFDKIDAEFKKEVFLDKILRQNKEFLTLALNCLVIDVSKKTLFVITNKNIYYTNFDKKEFIKTRLSQNTKRLGLSSHTSNGFVVTGGVENNKKLNLCTQYCPSRSVQKEFPQLLESRRSHRNYTLGTKIYTCGGYISQTVEVYEENAGKWIEGPPMNEECYSFGAADDNENNIYIASGYFSNTSSKSIEHLDVRTNNWQTIYTDDSIGIGLTQAQYKANKIYCFGGKKGYIFDIRANNKFSKIRYKLDNTIDFKFLKDGVSNFYDCTIFDNDIWVVGKMYIEGKTKIDAFKFNLQTTTWESQTFGGLENDDLEDVGLVWCT